MKDRSNDRGIVRMDQMIEVSSGWINLQKCREDASTDRGVVKDRSNDRGVVRMDQLIKVS